MNKEEIKSKFIKICINQFLANDSSERAVLYQRADLYQWAKEATERGDNFFYASPVDPYYPNGEMYLCDPEYKYITKQRGLTEEEFQVLFDE